MCVGLAIKFCSLLAYMLVGSVLINIPLRLFAFPDSNMIHFQCRFPDTNNFNFYIHFRHMPSFKFAHVILVSCRSYLDTVSQQWSTLVTLRITIKSLWETTRGNGVCGCVPSSILPVAGNDEGISRTNQQGCLWAWCPPEEFWGFWSWISLHKTRKTCWWKMGNKRTFCRSYRGSLKSFKLDLKREREKSPRSLEITLVMPMFKAWFSSQILWSQVSLSSQWR